MERKATIATKLGLHARPAKTVAKAASDTGSKITIGRPGDKQVNVASLLSLMSLGLRGGEEIVLVGDDADALETVAALIESDLDA